MTTTYFTLLVLFPMAALCIPLVVGLVYYAIKRDAWALSADRYTAPVVPHTQGTQYVVRGTLRNGTPYAIRGVYHADMDHDTEDFDPERTLYGYQAPLPSVAAVGGTVNIRGGR